ncbi:hypothetical protein ACFYY8_14600 [Streptosporangium sp. NPDC001559]|uniref:hypothetical protein n=1 Tax=Streptosporangium sp. NPDC001559 TaxID=3366187 RepID=UPI0036E79B20
MGIRNLSAAAVFAVALGAGTLAAAAPATAAPIGCRPTYPYNGAVTTYCSGGTGEHRAVCLYRDGQTVLKNFGAWVPTTASSSTWCPPATMIGGNVEIRG